jgi:hypothetical protein
MGVWAEYLQRQEDMRSAGMHAEASDGQRPLRFIPQALESEPAAAEIDERKRRVKQCTDGETCVASQTVLIHEFLLQWILCPPLLSFMFLHFFLMYFLSFSLNLVWSPHRFLAFYFFIIGTTCSYSKFFLSSTAW